MYPRHLSPATLFLRRFSDLNLRFITAGLLVGLLLYATSGFARAQHASSARSNSAAARLTQDLVTLIARYHGASSAEQARLLSDLLTATAGRKQFLASLIDDSPGDVLQVALPAAIRANLPPAVRDYVEEEVEVEGELEVSIEDYAKKSRTLYFLETGRERLSLHFAANPPKHLLTGARVHLKGILVDGALAVTSGDARMETLALGSSSAGTTTTASSGALANTFGAQKTLVILVNFQDNPTQQPWTLDQVRIVFDTVSNFFLENSYQQTWLSGDIFGWYTIPLNSTTCDQLGIASYAKEAAAAAGVDVSAYTRYVYLFPSASCQWSGSATVGGNPSQAWINGELTLEVVGHELGHNVGLHHSHSLLCNDATLGTNCDAVEYGDTLDIMGGSPTAHLNAFQKEFLGWLNSELFPPITTVQTSGTYVLDPYEPTGSNPKALKIFKGSDPLTGKKVWYYVEYRQAIGFDSYLASVSSLELDGSNILNGVVIHSGSPDESGNTSFLLDMTPETYHLYTKDPALVVGKSFSDPEAGVTISMLWANSSDAGVSVSFSQPSCMLANPIVAFSPSQSEQVQPGTPVTYSVSVTNNDNAGCSASSFNLKAIMPTEWTAAFSASALTLSPGTSASTTLTVTSPVMAIADSYTVGVSAANAANAAYADTATATYLIVAPLATTVSTDKLSYAAGNTVAITNTATSGGKPVANANVIFTVTKPNGAVSTQSATTNTSGRAVYKLRLNKQRDPAGIYQVLATATSNGASANATTSFRVQ